MIAVFARPNHPRYTTADYDGANARESGEWRYHGYVVAFVGCGNWTQVKRVQHKLATDGLPEPFAGHESYEQGWYGGVMDLVAVLPGRNPIGPPTENWTGWVPVRPENERVSIGDNRYAGFYTAKEIING